MFLSAEAEPFELFENVLPHAEAKGRTEDDLVSLCMQVPKCCAYMPSSKLQALHRGFCSCTASSAAPSETMY